MSKAPRSELTHKICVGLIIRIERIAGVRNAYYNFVRNSERKKSLGRPSYRWEDNIEMNLMEIG